MAKPIDSTTLEELKTFFKHLAFVACAGKSPIRQKMDHETLTRIAKAGSAENIARWSWWTPTQLGLLELADQLSKVIIIGGNGTGKTVMLETFAIKTAKENPDENVVFGINQYSWARPLLQLDLEVKFEKLKLSNLTVVSYENLSDLTDANSYNETIQLPQYDPMVENVLRARGAPNLAQTTNTTFCLDEIWMNDVKPDDLEAIKANSLWIVIRDTWRKTENPEEYIREQFPGWVIVNLTCPLRTSKILSEKVKSGTVSHELHTNNFNKSLKLAPYMPLGPEPLILSRYEGSYYERLQKAFHVVGKEKLVLIILDYDYMSPTSEEVKVAIKTTFSQRLANKTEKRTKNLLVGIESVKTCLKPHKTPLLWFDSDYEYLSDSKATIKNWMKGKNKTVLITDSYCVSGYEADIVILLGSGYVSAFMSRCRCQFIHIK